LGKTYPGPGKHGKSLRTKRKQRMEKKNRRRKTGSEGVTKKEERPQRIGVGGIDSKH